MHLWICYFATVISQRYIKYKLVHSSKLDFCDNICRARSVWARPKDAQNFLKRKFSVSLKKDLIFQFLIYFSASFAFYFLVSCTYSQTRATVSIKNETLNIQKSVIIDFVHKIWFCYSYLQEFAQHDSVSRASKNDGHRKGRLKVWSYVPMYT